MGLSPRDQFARMTPAQRRDVVERFKAQRWDLKYIQHQWRGWKARPEQLIQDEWDEFIILFLTGRGFGKTESGAQWMHEEARQRPGAMGGLLHRTSTDTREVMVEGPTGLLATCPPDLKVKYESSKSRVSWSNGFRCRMFSAEEPDSVRGANLSVAWGDEVGSFKHITGPDGLTAIDNLRFATRIRDRSKRKPKIVLTTTPKRVKFLRELEADPKVRVIRGSMMDNQHNLAPEFIESILKKYAGTALGSQEIDGLLAKDVEGSSFKSEHFERTRILNKDELPELGRAVIGVDPSVGDGSGDECGITVWAPSAGPLPAEFTHNGLTLIRNVIHIYMLEDFSMSGPPESWALRVVQAGAAYNTNLVVAEGNQGGQLVASVIRAANAAMRVKIVHAKVGKTTRASPVGALFAQGRAHLVGYFPEFEDQCTSYVEGDKESPDRMDAGVWAGTYLLPRTGGGGAVGHNPASLERPIG